MKKFLILTLIAVLAAPLGLEAQRKSGSRSSSSKSTSVRSSNSRKSSSSTTRSVKSTPSVKRSSSSVRSTPRSSSSRSKSFATPRSSSSSSRSVVRTKPGNSSRSTTVTRSGSSSKVTNRNYAKRDPDVRIAPSSTERERITNRAIDGRHENRVTPRSNEVYYSSRRFINERPVRYHYRVIPHPRDYRARFYPYRLPAYFHIYWSHNVFRYYCGLYPVIEYWSYTPDYAVSTISAYDALFHVGEIRRVYGKVSEVYYAKETDEFFLYFGAYYPYHDFTTVIPGNIARRFSRHPEFYFQDEHVEVTGLITEYEEKPEIVVKDKDQLRRY